MIEIDGRALGALLTEDPDGPVVLMPYPSRQAFAADLQPTVPLTGVV